MNRPAGATDAAVPAGITRPAPVTATAASPGPAPPRRPARASLDGAALAAAYTSGATSCRPAADPAAITVVTPADRLLTPAEAAAMLRVAPKTVARRAKAGKLDSIRTLGGHRRYSEHQVRSLLNGWQPGPGHHGHPGSSSPGPGEAPPAAAAGPRPTACPAGPLAGPPPVLPRDRTGDQMTDTAPAAYAQVADDLAARITAGEFPAGRLPGERPLAREYGVAYLTLRRATGLLRERGLIITSQGRPSEITRRLLDQVPLTGTAARAASQ